MVKNLQLFIFAIFILKLKFQSMRQHLLILMFFSVPCLAFSQPDTLFNQTDARNLKQGHWKKTYPNGTVMYRAFFKDDKPVGVMKRYFESGRLKALMNYRGDIAETRLFYETGNPAAEGRYYKTLKDSTWTYYSYYSNTITARENWNKGVRTGMMVSYYENGNISEKLEWKNNKKSGIWEQYFKGNILKMKAGYVDNKLEGEFVVYTKAGTPSITGTYRNNLRDGKWIFYDENGNVEHALNYNSGIASEKEKLNAEQQEFFRNIDNAQGKYNEPDETDFLSPR